MAITDSTLYAILALDSCSRGYNPALPDLSDASGTQFGGATIIARDGGAEAQAIGFYPYNFDQEICRETETPIYPIRTTSFKLNAK